MSPLAEQPMVREAALVALVTGGHDWRFVRHAATGRRTLCGIDLGGQVADPPAYDRDTAHICERGACARALRELTA